MLDTDGYVKKLNAKADQDRITCMFINMFDTFKSFYAYQRLDDDRKNVIDRYITIEFKDDLSSSNFMLIRRLATFLELLDDGCIPFFKEEPWADEYVMCNVVKSITIIAGEIVFAKPKHMLQFESDKDKHGYPLDKYHICFPTGHVMSVLFEWDNGSSKTVQRRCTRCGHEELDQYDYN